MFYTLNDGAKCVFLALFFRLGKAHKFSPFIAHVVSYRTGPRCDDYIIYIIGNIENGWATRHDVKSLFN